MSHVITKPSLVNHEVEQKNMLDSHKGCFMVGQEHSLAYQHNVFYDTLGMIYV